MAKSVNNSVQCVSSCSSQHPDYFSCGNGNCQIRSNGPNCFCPQSDSYWYTGWHCEQRISKVGVAVGVALGLAVLLIVILVLAILLCWQHQTWQPRLKNPAISEEAWYENDPEWSPPWLPRPHIPARDGSSSTSISAPAPTDPDGRSSSEDGRSSPPDQGTFRPRLDKVDTSLQ
ncbi:mucin-3B-like, partial [Sceloporus undulatus]|uniref:mucin-3B-like n=1 Tax=Sceloporus undulatus TaxID=8520 RepID=UPI001C4D7C5B